MSNSKQKQVVIWKTYPDYPFIEANQFGEVRTVDRYVPSKNGSKRLVKGRILKQHSNNGGYMYISFGVDNKQKTLLVHRIMAICFIPNPNDYPEVNHIDNDPTNNRWDNLEWCTHEYNNAYREKYGTACNRHVIAIKPETDEVLWFESQHEAGRKLGFDYRSINKVVKGNLNKTHGCWFCYADENAVEKTRSIFGDKIAEKVEELISNNLQTTY